MSTLVRVPFHGDELEAMKTEDGKVLVGLKKMCENLGVDVEPQRKKLKAKSWACTVEKTVQLENSGQQRVTTMIELDTVPLWLATIEERKVAEAVRPKLVKYQKECARVLADHFFNRKGQSELEDSDPTLAMLDAAKRTYLKQLEMKKQLDNVENRVNFAANKADEALRESKAAYRTLDNQYGWFTLLAYCKRTRRDYSVHEMGRHGKELAAIMRRRGQEPQNVSDPRFNRVNLYPEALLIEYFGDEPTSTVPAMAGC